MYTTAVGHYPKIGGKAPNLRTALNRLDLERITQEEVHRIEDENTVEVLEAQARAGLDVVTDGQVRWEDGQTHFARRLKGFSIGGLTRYFNTNTYYRQPVAEGPVAWEGPIALQDYQFAVAHSSKPVKAVITGPYTLARLCVNQAYPDLNSLALALAEALNQEALALQKAGAPLIQFDEPAILKYKEDFPVFLEAARRVTRGLTVKTAVSTWFYDISGLYPQFLQAPFQVIGLDFVSSRANLELLKKFPSDKELGFGVLDGRNTYVEPVEQIVEALRRIKRVVPLDRIHLSPSCGLEYLPRERAYQKLVRLVEGARKAQEVLA
ncbi:MAG: methylcobamide--CoM methyltransferase [Dehalococcoidia bacterium]|nr:methylcobamide--CoM methyltransferase [Dehalococcoidia bacterium]